MSDNEDSAPLDAAEMKARGYDPETIANVTLRAEELSHFRDHAQEVLAIIEEASSGVTLGSGVGLYEAGGLDDYADAATCADLRARDEKLDWRLLSEKPANLCNSMNFFDAEGMRFHLPAALTAELRGPGWGIEYHLARLDEDSRSRFALLNPVQRAAVCRFLELLADHPDYACDRPDIIKAITEYWTVA